RYAKPRWLYCDLMKLPRVLLVVSWMLAGGVLLKIASTVARSRLSYSTAAYGAAGGKARVSRSRQSYSSVVVRLTLFSTHVLTVVRFPLPTPFVLLSSYEYSAMVRRLLAFVPALTAMTRS